MASTSKPQRCGSANEDRISRLPEEILCHILSFLPIKYGFRTTLLSRRWKDIWISVANVTISDYDFVSNDSFVTFMEMFMIRRSYDFKSFDLSIWRTYTSSDVETWIRAAVLHNMEELYLSTSSGGTPDCLPRILFSCGSLKVLRLYYLFELKVPEHVCLPSLKVLHLISHSIFLYGGTIERLISGSPVIEELVIKNFYAVQEDVQTVNVQSSSLKYLSMRANFAKPVRVVLDAPKLEFLEFIGTCMYINVSNSSSIVKATIDMAPFLIRDETVDQALQLLCQIYNVKILKLSSTIIKLPIDLPNQNLPYFHNLTQLEVKCYAREWENLLGMLEFSPNLKFLKLTKGFSHNYCQQSLNGKKSTPACFMSSLEMFEFRDFGCTAVDIELLEYILTNAKVLKEVRISTCYRCSTKNPELLNKLIMFQRDSKNCKIIIS